MTQVSELVEGIRSWLLSKSIPERRAISLACGLSRNTLLDLDGWNPNAKTLSALDEAWRLEGEGTSVPPCEAA